MDPVITLHLIEASVRQGELEDACEHADALYAWYQRGGFLPPGRGAWYDVFTALDEVFAAGDSPPRSLRRLHDLHTSMEQRAS